MRTRLRQGTDVGRLVDWTEPVHLDDQTIEVIGLPSSVGELKMEPGGSDADDGACLVWVSPRR